jgi:UDP-N-acetylmuramoyl-L-alanyl-D-glutamate--2,6-diaminopimelate ligase
MRVSAVAARLKSATLLEPAPDTEIYDVTNDSRRVVSGALYVALDGEHFDGHQFIEESIRRGARAILCSRPPKRRHPETAYFVAENPRFAMSELAHEFFGRPSEQLEVIGITGTDGKTSTAHYLHQLLCGLSVRAAYLSTAGIAIGDDRRPNMLHQSTPEAPEVHRVLSEMLASGAETTVLESTSHGLSARTCRLAHVHYRAGLLTNVTHEHLEFHGSYEQYRHDKANLFRALGRTNPSSHPGFFQRAAVAEDDKAGPGSFLRPERAPNHLSSIDGPVSDPFGVVWLDQPDAGFFASVCETPLLTYSLENAAATVSASDMVSGPSASTFLLSTGSAKVPVTIPIPGRFNVLNLLGAATAAMALTGAGPHALVELIGDLDPAPGRTTVVARDPFVVIVDYAHTPGAFQNALPFFREITPGRVIVVFGSAGERDRAKRSKQGAIADRYADIIVLTDEDPRGEPSVAILEEIAEGCPSRTRRESLFMIPERREAIRKAYSLAKPGDTVLLLGKGHERSIIGPDGPSPWDEIAVAEEEFGPYQ